VPLFTVITVSYNSERYLHQTIDSVLAQRFEDFEYILADDCSTDDSWQIINSYNDNRIRRFRNDSNKGEYGNRNLAVQQARGDYIIFIDGDDIIYEHALSTLAGYIHKFPDCAMLFMHEWDPRILYPLKVDPQSIYRFEYLDNTIVGGNFTRVVFKSGVLKENQFPEGIRTGDTFIQLKIAQRHAGLVVPSGLTWWRRRNGNATSQFFGDNRHFAETLNYRLDFLGEDCPLSSEEKERAKLNIYGLYMRQLLRLMGKLRFSEVAFLAKRINIPYSYWLAVFKKSKHDFYNFASGDSPLHSNATEKPSVKSI